MKTIDAAAITIKDKQVSATQRELTGKGTKWESL